MSFIKKHKFPLLIVAVIALAVPVLFIGVSYYIIKPCQQFVRTQQTVEPTKVGIVLGAGLAKNGKPYDELKARLDSAADALNDEKVQVLILSGDNRFDYYNEPNAMKEYLVSERGISADKLVPDYAGRSTYESCERAKKIFNVDKAVIFSAGSHLPRAVYLCRHFGVAAVGIPSGVEANNSTRREVLARVKAVYNVHLNGEPTVLGEPEQLP